METLPIYKINFSSRDSIETTLIQRYGNTKNLYDNCKDSYYSTGQKILEYETVDYNELEERILSGKVALFPISKSTDTFLICNHNRLGIIPVMTPVKYYKEFRSIFEKNNL